MGKILPEKILLERTKMAISFTEKTCLGKMVYWGKTVCWGKTWAKIVWVVKVATSPA
jgi:hypothetical protein